MKEILQLEAKYNDLTNKDMINILKTLDSDLLTKDFGLYYKSIIGTLNHLLIGDIMWIKRFINFCPEISSIGESLPVLTIKDYKEIQWKTLAEFESDRYKTDNIIISVFDLISEDKYHKSFTYKNFRGEDQTKIAWKTFIHMFNHETHHRGQIAAVLDQLKVENDYSNLIWKF